MARTEELMGRIAAILNTLRVALDKLRAPEITLILAAKPRQFSATSLLRPERKRGREILYIYHAPLRHPLPSIHRQSRNETRHIFRQHFPVAKTKRAIDHAVDGTEATLGVPRSAPALLRRKRAWSRTGYRLRR